MARRRQTIGGRTDTEDLAEWLEAGYAHAFRTACLLLGNRADAEEAVQEAFLRAWRFRASLGSGASIRPWLYRVVVNTCCSKLRHEIPHRDRRSEVSDLSDMASDTASPDDAVWRSEVADGVLRAVHDLPEHLRVAVALRYYTDLSEREVAIAIGRRPGTVKSRLHEARRLLAAHPALQSLVPGSGVADEVLR